MRVLVTGGNGHLGFNLVQALLARGHAVRTTVRSLADHRKTAPLAALGGVELAEADVRQAAPMRAALQGVEWLFHAAAVYSVAESGRDDEILESALRGTEVALRAAAAAGVRQVVMTSSVVTIPLTVPGAAPLNEAHWTSDLRVAYVRAKVESERLAWTLAEELGLRLVTILPAGIIGPGFARNTPSIDLIQAALMGLFRLGAPTGNFSFVDVRDVAEAHCLAAERGARGRFIVGYDLAPSFDQLVRLLAAIDRRVKPPLMVVPVFAAPLLPYFDRVNHRLLGTPRLMNAEGVATILSGKVCNFTSARAKSELGWSARTTFEQSLRDTIAVLDASAGARP